MRYLAEEIAEYIGQVLREAGDEVDVRRVQDVQDLAPDCLQASWITKT